jgi:flagellar hook-associated protein 2
MASTSSIGIDGLVSGLDTTSLINKLMAVEANQQTLLKSRQSTASALSSTLQTLNTKVASLATAAKAASSADSWSVLKATSSATSVSAAASSTARPTTLTFTVDAVATTQSSLAALPADLPATSPTFTITHGDGTTSTVTAASGSLPNVLDALNGSGTGLTATAVNVGTGAAPDYRLQLTGATTGADGAFSISYQGGDGQPHDLDLTQVRAASSASITLFPGTAAQQVVTQGSNTFTGLATGLDVTVTAVEKDPVTVTTTRDSSNASKLASTLVANLNVVLSELADRTASSTTTDSDGRTVVTPGVLSGDSTIRALRDALVAQGSSSPGGLSPANAGIVLNKDGTFTFDADAFATSLAANPDQVQQLVTSLASGVATVAQQASDATTGTITAAITSQDALVDDLGDRIADWDTRLADRRASLQTVYANLEVSLSNLQSQSSWLASQIDSLTSSTSSS